MGCREQRFNCFFFFKWAASAFTHWIIPGSLLGSGTTKLKLYMVNTFVLIKKF